MPELPEVESLRRFLDDRCPGRVVERTQLLDFACLKTAAIPLAALHGMVVTGAVRRGKFLGLALGGAEDPVSSGSGVEGERPAPTDTRAPGSAAGGATQDEQRALGGVFLVTHLARAGWLRWHDVVPAPTTPTRPGRGPLAFRLAFADGAGFSLTEAGTRKRLAVYVVNDLAEVPGIVTLGPEPLEAAFTEVVLDHILDDAGNAQIKGVLRDQRTIAGIGNAYSDEILWAARLSPFAASVRLDADQRHRLYEAIQTVLTDAIARSSDLVAGELKAEKKSGLQVHGRAGQPCPVCGTTVATVDFADTSWQYCPGCQTGGKVLADRRLSRLLK